MSNGTPPTWVQIAIPLLIIMAGFGIIYAFNLFVGLAVVVIGLAILISRAVQRRSPPEPGG